MNNLDIVGVERRTDVCQSLRYGAGDVFVRSGRVIVNEPRCITSRLLSPNARRSPPQI